MTALGKQETACGADPFAPDSKWGNVKWMVYRGTAYDITDFIAKHPGGEPRHRVQGARCACLGPYHRTSDVCCAPTRTATGCR